MELKRAADVFPVIGRALDPDGAFAAAVVAVFLAARTGVTTVECEHETNSHCRLYRTPIVREKQPDCKPLTLRQILWRRGGDSKPQKPPRLERVRDRPLPPHTQLTLVPTDLLL